MTIPWIQLLLPALPSGAMLGLSVLLATGPLPAVAEPAPDLEKITIAAPFPMPVLQIPRFPARDFRITDFGAEADGDFLNTEAIARAIAACHAAGGSSTTPTAMSSGFAGPTLSDAGAVAPIGTSNAPA